MSEYLIDNVEEVLIVIDELIDNYQVQHDERTEKGQERMAISFNGSILGLKALKARITGEDLELTKTYFE